MNLLLLVVFNKINAIIVTILALSNIFNALEYKKGDKVRIIIIASNLMND